MLFLFDVDGTLIRSFLREGGGADSYDLIEVLPGRVEKLEELRQQGHSWAIVTNQAGIAFGYQTSEQVNRKLYGVLEALGKPPYPNEAGVEAFIVRKSAGDDFPHLPPDGYVSLVHPKGKLAEYLCDPEDDWRKPGGGMIRQAMKDYGVQATDVVYVGDMESDRLAAQAAGVAYVDAEEFFS